MSDIVKESLNKLKVTLQNSNQQIVTFKKQNKDFRDVSISSDAIYQCVCEYAGQIYMSNLMV
jgi:predicted glycosyltransferase involved in capsule biosynthesis